MTAKLLEAWGYQGDPMALPVADVDASAAYYVDKLGFEITERADGRVVLQRDGLKMAINENGGDPTQDGVAFLVDDIEQLHKELTGRKPKNSRDQCRDKIRRRLPSLLPRRPGRLMLLVRAEGLGSTSQAQPNCRRLWPSFQTFVMCLILSPSKSMTYT